MFNQFASKFARLCCDKLKGKMPTTKERSIRMVIKLGKHLMIVLNSGVCHVTWTHRPVSHVPAGPDFFLDMMELCIPPQHTQNICITFIQCWTNVEDVGPTLYKCYKCGSIKLALVFVFFRPNDVCGLSDVIS